MNSPDMLTRALAQHEAGHQAVAYALDVPVYGTELTPQGARAFDGLRQENYDGKFMTGSEWERARKRALILLAGELAERLFYEHAGSAADQFWSASDWCELKNMMQELFGNCGPVPQFATEALIQETDKLLLAHWTGVQRVAEQLLYQQKLTAVEVQDILCRESPLGQLRYRKSIVWE